ncbi:MAG: Superoxide dismutase [Mn] 2 [Candidatus Anoxychlamydiales bacterium]|nr:Superoxide dismutase [Mn] 2 [Candidatus Anoxychlamydiales bacterium]NGX35742.1 Superoxide dismutase [Mn] 2 [Candidatus Anoxychlamydiales bacterium]
MSNYQLPDLDYDYGDLEPVMTAQMLEIHHDKHHRAYVNNLNAALEKYHEAEKKKDAEKMVGLQSAIKFNGGGHINHSIFWQILAPIKNGGGVVDKNSSIYKAIETYFTSFENFQETLNAQTTKVQGSGWGWLGYNRQNKSLTIQTSQNHDLLSARGIFPIFCIDVWEHAYYLKYKNLRPSFVQDIWKILNWKEIENRYKKIIS